jgi:hypothetical protein
MRFNKVTLGIALAIVSVTFFAGLYMMTYVEPSQPLTYPISEDRPYELYGLAVSVFSFCLTVVMMWVGAIHLKVMRLKELNEARSEGRLTEEEFQRKVKELLNEL